MSAIDHIDWLELAAELAREHAASFDRGTSRDIPHDDSSTRLGPSGKVEQFRGRCIEAAEDSKEKCPRPAGLSQPIVDALDNPCAPEIEL